MVRRHPDEMHGEELSPVCQVAKRSDARNVESALDKDGIEYTFEISPVISRSFFGAVFGGRKNGVTFLVRKDELEHCRTLIERAGLGHLIIG